VEAARVPRAHVEGWRRGADQNGAMEAIGQRIAELPDRPRDFERRDSRTTFTAYVPPGSLARGKVLASTGAAGGSRPGAAHRRALPGRRDCGGRVGRIPATRTSLAAQLIRQLG
jgi:hypothetical protein